MTSTAGKPTSTTPPNRVHAPTRCPRPETNTKRCFPTFVDVPGRNQVTGRSIGSTSTSSTQVIQGDRTGHSPDMVTDYDYRGGAAWHFDDDDGLTKEKYKTWSQWRGYATVRVWSGGENDHRTQTDHQLLPRHGRRPPQR